MEVVAAGKALMWMREEDAEASKLGALIDDVGVGVGCEIYAPKPPSLGRAPTNKVGVILEPSVDANEISAPRVG